jgi:hypothetical protein
MESKTVRFSNPEWLPVVTGLRKEYAVEYSIVDTRFVGEPDEASLTKTGRIVVGISSTLESKWGLDTETLERVLFEYAKRHIKGKVFDNTLSTYEEIQLTSLNAPDECPFDPTLIEMSFGSEYTFPVSDRSVAERAAPPTLAAQIIDLRDNVNALFGDRFKGRLLGLPQERSLLELFHECDSQEEFTYRLVALCGLAISIDTNYIRKQIEASDDQKSLDVLGEFLRKYFSDKKANQIMGRLQNFNRLRRMYPVHTDRARGVMEAHKFFDLDYPVRDYQAAWIKLLEAYSHTLELLMKLLKSD